MAARRGGAGAALQLVVGASSFAGRHALAALGREFPAVRRVELDGDLEASMAGVDTVHLASELRSPLARHPLGWTPHPALGRILEAARRSGVRRLVHLSSAAVLGGGRLAGEATTPRPRYACDRHALRDEEWLLARAGLEVVVLRPARPFGAGEPLLEALLAQLRSGVLRLPDGGGAPGTFLAGADLGRAFAAAARRGRPGRAYLLGGFEGAWRDLLRRACGAAGVPPTFSSPPRAAALALAALAVLGAPSGAPRWPTPRAVDLVARPQLLEDGWSRRELSWSPLVGSFEEGLRPEAG